MEVVYRCCCGIDVHKKMIMPRKATVSQLFAYNRHSLILLWMLYNAFLDNGNNLFNRIAAIAL